MKAMRWILRISIAVFFAALLAYAGIDSYYYQTKPRLPDSSHAKLETLTVWHNTVVYVTEREEILFNETRKWAGISMLVSFTVLGLIKVFFLPDNSINKNIAAPPSRS